MYFYVSKILPMRTITGTLITFILLVVNTLGEHVSAQSAAMDQKKPALLFVGTYTDGKSQGIYLYQMDRTTGALSYVSVSPKTANPSYLVIHPNHKWLYAVNELGGSNDKYLGAVSAFRIDLAKKQLEFVNTVPSHGNYPCHISIDASGRYVFVANYGSGNIAMYPINKDGSLADASFTDQHRGKGPNANRQEGPHAHMIMQGFDPRFVYNTDLGMDKILVYKLDDVNAKLLPTDMDASAEPGSGPRHIAFHPNREWAYVVNELKGTIEVFSVDKLTGALTRFQDISTLAEGETREPGSADVHITPNGKYLYATNRGEISNIAMFAIDQESGKLRLLGHQSVKGKTPRNFVIDSSGTFVLVANQNSSNVVTFRIDQATGILKETGIETEIPNPVCLKFLE